MTRRAAWLTEVAAIGLPTAAWAQERTWDWGWVVVGLIALVRWLDLAGTRAADGHGLEILRQHYARGEINKDEFDARKRDLS